MATHLLHSIPLFGNYWRRQEFIGTVVFWISRPSLKQGLVRKRSRYRPKRLYRFQHFLRAHDTAIAEDDHLAIISDHSSTYASTQDCVFCQVSQANYKKKKRKKKKISKDVAWTCEKWSRMPNEVGGIVRCARSMTWALKEIVNSSHFVAVNAWYSFWATVAFPSSHTPLTRCASSVSTQQRLPRDYLRSSIRNYVPSWWHGTILCMIWSFSRD